jgi:hypothetical protein
VLLLRRWRGGCSAFSNRLYDVDGMGGGLLGGEEIVWAVWWGDVGYSWRAGVGVFICR